ncbi:MAG: GNAT family N-acetyltransferase [Candidatus Ancillula sp.]|nr:GNAT family N-acetyltransferase [Candidatus Ancillula sp.]
MEHFILETQRFLLDSFIESDKVYIIEYCNNSNVNKFLYKLPYPYTFEDAVFYLNQVSQNWKKGNILTWAIRDKKTNKFIGTAEIRKDLFQDSLGLWICSEFQNKGVGYEILSEIIKWSKNNHYTKDNIIYYSHPEGNINSGKLALKLGFKFDAIYNSSNYIKSNLFDRQGEYFNYYVYIL